MIKTREIIFDVVWVGYLRVRANYSTTTHLSLYSMTIYITLYNFIQFKMNDLNSRITKRLYILNKKKTLYSIYLLGISIPRPYFHLSCFSSSLLSFKHTHTHTPVSHHSAFCLILADWCWFGRVITIIWFFLNAELLIRQKSKVLKFSLFCFYVFVYIKNINIDV